MEKPHYGRTGLLASRLSGLPVTQPRLITSSTTSAAASPVTTATSRTLKWYPSLLTVPQQLLDALRREDEAGEEDEVPTLAHRFCADPTLVTYLRVATIAEALIQRWRHTAVTAQGTGELQQSVSSSSAPPSRGQIASLYAAVLKWSRGKAHRAATSLAISTPSSKNGTFFIPAYKLLVMKDGKKVTEYVNVTWRSVWLLGKEPVVNDVPLEHPSCSAQHAALETRFVLVNDVPLNEYVETHTGGGCFSAAGLPSYTCDSGKLQALCDGMWAVLEDQLMSAAGDATAVWTVELQLTDLGSTNRTKLNGAVVPAMEATTVIESDVLEFGCSTRKYVVLRNA